jgi:hypothetical protein
LTAIFKVIKMKETTRQATPNDKALVILVPANAPKAQIEAEVIRNFLSSPTLTYISVQDGKTPPHVIAKYVKDE